MSLNVGKADGSFGETEKQPLTLNRTYFCACVFLAFKHLGSLNLCVLKAPFSGSLTCNGSIAGEFWISGPGILIKPDKRNEEEKRLVGIFRETKPNSPQEGNDVAFEQEPRIPIRLRES